ncbi:uncharacterized protein LOC122653170 [Telopea speciosissima]|uniref:uncharacterized protein LOC122653170 n=1 Tax=Telopea speciosissima TaxID=54955 RepID=UPI001CC5AF55|nr:uncharacterized protein LOC122653170 [Telopea speciosissima]
MLIVLAIFVIAAVSSFLNVRKLDVHNVEVMRLEANNEVSPSTQLRMDILDQISVTCSPLELNPKVQIHENFANKRQIEVKIPDIVSLLHQVQSDSPESGTSTHHRIYGELISEESTPTVIPNISELISSSPTQLATSSVEDVGQIPELNFELKVTCWVIPLSAGGIIGVLAGFPGNEMATLPHKILFKVYTWLTYASFIFGVGLFLLTFTPKHSSFDYYC